MWRFPVLSAALGTAGLALAHDLLLNGLPEEHVEIEDDRRCYVPSGGGFWDHNLRDPSADFSGGD
jgi:hypothetical protein